MIDVICPHCRHIHKEDDSLINWNWYCEACGKIFRWNAYDKFMSSSDKEQQNGKKVTDA